MKLRGLAKFAAVIFLASTCSIYAAAAARGSFQKTLQVTGPADLQVLTHSGDIVVHTGAPGSVAISARIHGSTSLLGLGSASDKEIRAIEQNPPIHQTGNLIKVDYPPYGGVSIDYDITVPPDTALRANTGSGSQNVRGLRGRLDLHAGSGDIQLDDTASPARVGTGSGNIQGGGIGSSLDASAGSGDIRLTFTGAGDVRIHTGSGDVQARGINGSLVLETGSGDVTVDGRPKGKWTLRASSGDVRLHLPQDASFEVDASSGSGDVTINRPVSTTVQGRIGQSSRRHIAGKVGNGGPLLEVGTGSGDISIN